MYKLVIIILLSFLTLQLVSGIEYDISANFITMQNGLSDNNVNCILKDEKGFIWFGTSDGLNRYDGFNVKTFYPFEGTFYIHTMHECERGYIWLGTNDGLFAFDPKKEAFILHYIPSIISPIEQTLFIATDIANNQNGGLLITSPLGLGNLQFTGETIDTSSISFEWIPIEELKNEDLALTCIAHDKNETFWFGTNTSMIIRYDIKNKSTQNYSLSSINNKAPHFIITSIAKIKEQIIVSSIGHGIHILNQNTGQIKNISYDSANTPLSHRDVYGIIKHEGGDYWAATWDGLDQFRLNNDSTEITHYNWDHPALGEQFENRIISILNDESGVIWLGTHGGGAVKLNLKKRFFKRIVFNSLYEVKDFAQDKFNQLYLAIYHGGIKKTKLPLAKNKIIKFDNYSTIPDKHLPSIPTDIVLSTVADEQGDMWFGTLNTSLLNYQAQKNKIEEIKITIHNNTNWKGRINCLFIDSKKRFWMGSDNGLILYDKNHNKFTLLQSNPQKSNHLSGDYIQAIIEDKNGSIWVGTDQGLNKLIADKNNIYRFNHFNDANTSPHILSNKTVWTIHEMSNGKLWIGYRGGIGYYDKQHGNITFLTKKDGLCHNFVTCIESHGDDLWIGTNSGISKLNTNTLDFTNYYIANNLRAVHQTNDGTLIWGNNKGLIYFHPDNIKKHQFIPSVELTAISINNKKLSPGERINKHVIMSKASSYTKSIVLRSPINSFAIEYVALSYLHQTANLYEYRLKNYNDDWIRVGGNQRTLTYNNLPPGNYTFEVRAANCDGIWNKNSTSLDIRIEPVWYKTLPGIFGISLAIIGLIALIFFIRLKQIYREQKIQVEKKKLEYELNISKLEREKEHELTEMKTRFFTNISHELRTPLTLIVSPIKELLSDKQLPLPIRSKLELINRHVHLLYDLITQLLDYRKTVKGKMPLKVSSFNLSEHVCNIIDTFKPLASTQQIIIQTNTPTQSPFIWYDIEKMRIIVSNLLSNAIKFSPQGEIITISIEEINNNYSISVKDNGPGISKEEHSAIFDRFYQTNAESNNNLSGTGIGLELVREYVQLHNGSIELVSSPGNGATFTVVIAKGNDHFKSDELLKETVSNIKDFTHHIPVENNRTKVNINKKELPPILIVEDNHELRSYLITLFSNEYSVHDAINGQEALEKLKDINPVAIISDIMMPIMDGIVLCKTIKEDIKLCHIPVILLTAKSNEIDVLSGLEIGADDYITKPFTPQIVLTKINNLIFSRTQLKEYYGSKITLAPADVEIEPAEELFLRKAIKHVEQNLTNIQFGTEMMAQLLNMSQATLYRRIKTITGDNISVFIRSIRLKRAAQLLQKGTDTIADVSAQIGFNDVAYFRNCFSKQFGVTPSKYKASKRINNT